MSFAPSTIYLITGANRGLGLALVTHIADTYSDALIYAGARDPTKASELKDLEAKYPGRITTLKYVSGDEEGNKVLAKEIDISHGRLDTVIANAAVVRIANTVLETPAREFEEHLLINVVGTAVLFQAVHHLLKASSTPRFVPITTGAAAIGHASMALPLRTAAYGSSKAALNHITRKIHFENEWLVAFPLAPGVTMTDSFVAAVESDPSGLLAKIMDEPNSRVQTPVQAATKIVRIANKSTREKEGGEFVDGDGTRSPW